MVTPNTKEEEEGGEGGVKEQKMNEATTPPVIVINSSKEEKEEQKAEEEKNKEEKMNNIDSNSEGKDLNSKIDTESSSEQTAVNKMISDSISSSSFEEINAETEESFEKKKNKDSFQSIIDEDSNIVNDTNENHQQVSVNESIETATKETIIEESSKDRIETSSETVSVNQLQIVEESSENYDKKSLKAEEDQILLSETVSIEVDRSSEKDINPEKEIVETSLNLEKANVEEEKVPIPKMREEPVAAPRPIRRLSIARASMMAPKPSPRLAKYMQPVREEGQKKKKARSMFSWLGGDSSKKKNKEVLETVSEGLRKIYKQKLLPLEEYHKYHDFHSPALDDPDFDAKPMILLVGQYSTGKTTFIRYLLESDFPGIRIGPEPTTDRFIAVMHGDEEGSIPGNALVVDAKKQFRALSGFGNAFLNRFQCSTLPNQVLESVTIVDTPGILSGEKQRIDRGYDFTGVLEWFAERVDRIILLFDAHKLDISDEFKRCIEALAGNEDKIRIVLNKSDMVDHQQLMRVYGALMWSLGKVFKTPEVSRVYLGSFWDHPLHYDINRRLFQDEQHDLFQDLQALPRNAALRKLNDLIKRARLAKVHAYIIAELRKQMPSMIGKERRRRS
uniref:Dynamin-type G domain-containing protein n=1 Tax=Caenorhabditis tropicalis TaxID=1561998 RepID=A0A1I7UMX4_9PELO